MACCGFRSVVFGLLASIAAARGGMLDIGGGNPDAGLPYDIRAAELGSRDAGSILTAKGSVYIKQGRQIITAGYVEVNRKTDEVIARDNVVFVRWDGTVWKGKELTYNFKTGAGDFGKFLLYQDPYYLHGGGFKMVSKDQIELQDVVLTTCEGDSREFEIQASSATLTDQKYLTMRNVTTYLGPVPVFWTPYYRRNIAGGAGGGWALIPGYSSRLGGFLLSTYHYWFDDDGTVKGETSLNLYSERGVGLGQNVMWEDKESTYKGNIEGFFISDNRIYKDEQQEEERKDTLTDEQRYRLRLRHQASVSERDALFADGTYLSDPFVQEDFFRRDNRERVQPENRASWTHRGDSYIFSLLANARLNDFYDNVDRLPEATLTVPALRLGESPLYYESQTAASGLRRVFPEGGEDEEYDAARIDTQHMLYLPKRFFGFLALTPRAGWRGTYYSTTYGPPVSVTNTVTSVDSNGVSSVGQDVATTQEELGADLRSLIELGFETSYKAYKVLREGETIWGRGLRHVVEPYARHTYIPDADLLPENLPQFDSIDRIEGEHTVQFGFRHKFQTRRKSMLFVDHSQDAAGDPLARNAEGMDQAVLREMASAEGWSVHDLVNADIGTKFKIERDDDEDELGPLYFNTRIWPSEVFRFDFNSQFDLYGEGLTLFDGQVSLTPRNDLFQMSANYIFQPDQRDLIAAQFQFFPRAKWTVGAYARYDMLGSRLEEHSYFLRHKMDCIGWGVGIRHEPGYEDRDDDIAAWFQIWLLAMPQLTAEMGG